jgi:hypothetical protein
MKTGPDALGTAGNDSESVEDENMTQNSARKIRKRDPTPSVPSKTSPDAKNMKTGHVALKTV